MRPLGFLTGVVLGSASAISLVLLVGALLFGQSLRNLLTAETGIVSDGVVVATVNLKLLDLAPERRRAVYSQLEERLNALPDVISAAAIQFSPFSGSQWNQDVYPDGQDVGAGKKLSWFNRVSPGYFRTMQTPLLAGRVQFHLGVAGWTPARRVRDRCASRCGSRTR